MGIEKHVQRPGDGVTFPHKGDTVTIEYTGFLFDSANPASGFRGMKFDSSVGRADFVTPIGEGRVIKGWDEGVVNMSLGERATLVISSDFAYGPRGFPGLIPPNSSLVFDVELKGINNRRA